ncbi:MAG: glycosyltransferase family protein [Candidatus Woesearchaeota archaeon]
MRILYAASGEGYGHAIRSKPIIDFLRKKNKVKIAAGGKARTYFSKYYPVSRIATLRLIYVNNKVSNILTVLFNILQAPLILLSVIKLIYTFVSFKPSVVVNDFETFTHYIALLAGIPVISVDNQNILAQARISVPKGHKINYFKTLLTIKLLSPRPTFSLVPTFFYPEVKSSRTDLLYPVIRNQIHKLKPSNKGHLLVYQTSKTNKVLHDVLKKSNHNCIIYGFDIEETDCNIVHKKFNEKEFFDDLASCKALITNGGFTLISEALHLKKPILSNPIASTFEQVVNAYYLDKLGYGLMAEKLDSAVLNRFLKQLPKYVKNLESYKKEGNSMFFNRLGELIKSVSQG